MLPMWSRRKLLLGAGALLTAGQLPVSPARAGGAAANPPGVYPPPWFDTADAMSSIRAEHENTDSFFAAYAKSMEFSLPGNGYGLALAHQTIGLLRNDASLVVRAGMLFAMHRNTAASAKERHLADLGARYCRNVLSGQFPEAPVADYRVDEIQYVKDPAPAAGFKRIVLGRSVIHVTEKTVIKTQVDRVARDWLLAFHLNRAPWALDRNDVFDSHEGARTAELIRHSNATVLPVWGMKAVNIGEAWYGPDATGKPRFEILTDKIGYPSTIGIDSRTAIVNDTHGFSAIAWDATDANLAIGCADYQGKVDAAFYLADNGVDVYAPCDRLVSELIGARTKGTIIGSGPVKKTSYGAEIGNQAVEIDVSEPIVVSNAADIYPVRYYDAPYRYFSLLGKHIGRPLNLIDVQVTEYGKATNVVDAARRAGASVLGIRVKSVLEHDAVADWLKEDGRHRAVLFHSAPYRDGYRLFAEFPIQTTFGDIRPVFE